MITKEQTKAKKGTKAISDNDIVVKGARIHNLKDITVSFPRNRFIVVTGVSGSGNHHLLETPCLQKVNAGMQKALVHMQDSL